MENYFFSASAKQQHFNRIVANLTPAEFSEFFDKIIFSTIINDMGLEGVPVNWKDVQAILQDRVISIVKFSELVWDVKDFNQTLRYYYLKFDLRKPITLEDLKEIHVQLTAHCSERGGKYRKDIPIHRAYYHNIMSPDKISYQLKKLLDEINSNEFEKMHPLEFASQIHYDYMAIFPFRSFAGRVGRILLNLMLRKYGFMPIVLPCTERLEYYQALQTPFNGLSKLISRALENTLDSCLKLFPQETQMVVNA